MTLHHRVIGIDISKNHLDLHDSAIGRTWRMANSPGAIADWLDGLDEPDPFIVFEATGGYDFDLWQALEARGCRFARVNPAQARAFARAQGYLAKTDRIDAAMLAEMGLRLGLEPTPPSCPNRLDLQALARRRSQLVEIAKQEKTRLKQARDPYIAHTIETLLATFKQAIREIETRIAELVRSSQDLAGDYRLMTSVPGVGPVTATALLALMPEIGTISRTAVAALAGLAPINNDSGNKRGHRTIRGGRREVRRNLYMAAVAAIRGNTPFAAFHKSLRDRELPPKVAIVAVARKILVILNAIIRTRTPYTCKA